MIDHDRLRKLVDEPDLTDEEVDELLDAARQLVEFFLYDVLRQSGETPFYGDSVLESDN